MTALLLAAAPVAAQVRILQPPTDAERKAGEARLRDIERRAVAQLQRTHGDPRFGRKLGENLRGLGQIRLAAPSAALRAAVASASDPGALALAIAGDDDSDIEDRSYDLDVLMTAQAQPAGESHRALLLAKAAAIERDDEPLRLAFLQRADELLAAHPPAAGNGPSCGLAAWRLEELLDAGLAHEAVEYASRLSATLRGAVLEGDCGVAAIEQVQLASTTDPRLPLVTAMWLDGDAEHARQLLASTPGRAWQAGASPVDDAATTLTVWRALLEHVLVPAAGDDGFPLLAEVAGRALLLPGEPGPQVAGVGVVGFARAAEQEHYPELAAYGWQHVPIEPPAAPADLDPLPPEIAALADGLRRRLAEEARRASAALERAATEAERAHRDVRLVRDGKPFVPDGGATVIAIAHDGRTGILLSDHPPYFGDWYRLEARDGAFEVTKVTGWIS